jgi:acetyl-CoA hydrolase
MLLSDMGAEVILIEREDMSEREMQLRAKAIFHRGKRSIVLHLKDAADAKTARQLVAGADCLIEGMRPGVMERLGLGPDVCLKLNPRLVYGRMTGWGQTGPLSQVAGHDINYLALSGALWFSGAAGDLPITPPTLVGDLGGGALYLAVGLLAGVLHARASGKGQVIDAAIVDGAANLSNILLSVKAAGQLSNERGVSAIDGSHWYGSYRCRDGRYVTIGAIEPKFYAEFVQIMGLGTKWNSLAQYDSSQWNAARVQLTEIFLTRSQAEWTELLEGTDVCFAPVLDLETAASHSHVSERNSFAHMDGILQAMPAPRFSAFPCRAPHPIPKPGQHQRDVIEMLIRN